VASGNEYIDWSLDSTTSKPLSATGKIKKLTNGEWSSYTINTGVAKPQIYIHSQGSAVPVSGAKYKSPWVFLVKEGGDPNWEKDFINANKKEARKLFDKYIYPMAIKAFRVWGVEELSDPSLTLEKNLYTEWERNLDPDKAFKKMRQSFPSTVNFYEVEYYSLGITDQGGGYTSVPYLANTFGWSEYAGTQFDSTNPIANPSVLVAPQTQSGSAGLVYGLNQAEKNTAKRAILNARKGKQKTTSNLTPEEQNSLNQCALMSDLLHQGWSYTVYPSKWTDVNKNHAFNGRIYPVTVQDRIDPNELINLCTVPDDIKTFFADRTIESDNLWWSLHWVYNDSEGLKDAQIYLKSDDPNNDYDPVRDLINEGKLTKAQLDKWNADRVERGYTFEEIQIDYDGTNPSTARNDVKVTMRIEMDHMNSLDTVCAYGGVIESSAHTPPNLQGLSSQPAFPAKGGAAQVRLVDLITIPQVKSVDVTTPGGQGYHKNTFTPDTSRIRLKVWYDEESARVGPQRTYATETALILDLALIDHEIKRHDDSANKTTLTITYRGYFEESMNVPYNDAIVNSTIIQNRADREAALNQMAKRKCGDKLLREMQRVINEFNRVETQQYIDSGGMIAALIDQDKIRVYEIDQTAFDAGRIGKYLLTDYKYVDLSSIQPLRSWWLNNGHKGPGGFASRWNRASKGGGGSAQLKRNIAATVAYGGLAASVSSGGPNFNPTGDFYQRIAKLSFVKMFIMLGDVIDFALDSLYKKGSNTHYSHTKDMNMRFIVGTIKVPHPKDPTKSLTINPLQIPIDLGFFSSWYHDTIVKKGITNYAVGPFIRDLLERLVNSVIYDTCFSALSIDENPPQIRSCYFSDHSDKWFNWSSTKKPGTAMNIRAVGQGTVQNTDAWFDPKDPYATNQPQRILIKKDIKAPVGQSKNYCVIYQQFPSYFRQTRNGAPSLKNQPTTIDIYDGYNNKYGNFTTMTTFTKVNPSSYLREARYFNNNFGVLALLANVYDLSFTIQTKKMNTCFYPGNIINFIVTDFGPSAFTDIVRTPLGESDPHIANTRANVLGYGGYYIITKVSYTLYSTQDVGSSMIKVTGKFLGTDANLNISKQNAVEDIFIDEPQLCVNTYNDQLEKLRLVDPAVAGEFVVGVTTNPNDGQIQSLPPITTPAQEIVEKENPDKVDKAKTNDSDIFAVAMQHAKVKSNRVAGYRKKYEVGDLLITAETVGFVATGVALASQGGVISSSPIPGTSTQNLVINLVSSDGRSKRYNIPI